MARRRDLQGQQFGRWTVNEAAPIRATPAGRTRYYWLCRCECGNEREVGSADLLRGTSKSCGCLQRELARGHDPIHGYSRTPMYSAWKAMLQRCRNPKNTNYATYGGRGITVCSRWEKFEDFLADMGERPNGMTLDRMGTGGRLAAERAAPAPDLRLVGGEGFHYPGPLDGPVQFLNTVVCRSWWSRVRRAAT